MCRGFFHDFAQAICARKGKCHEAANPINGNGSGFN
jgi:hypothetical protein